MDQPGVHDLNLAERLIEHYPAKAADILARIFRDDKIKNEASACFIPPQKHSQPDAVRSANRLEVVIPPRPQARSISSRDSGSPPPSRRRGIHVPEPEPSMLSPPRTVSSTGSRSIKAAPRDYILFTVTENGIPKEKPFLMRTASIPYSLIRYDIADRLHAEIDDEGEMSLPITRPEDPTVPMHVRVNSSTKLTWCRPKSDATHETKFYIVSRGGPMADVPMADVILGWEETGERPPEHVLQTVLQSQNHEAYWSHPVHHVPPPTHIPPAPSHSYHHSAYSAIAHPHHTNTSRVEEYVAQQAIPRPDTNFGRHSQHSTAQTVIESRAPRSEHSLPYHPPSTSHTPSAGGAHSTSNRELRLQLQWGRNTFKMWVDLDHSADAFFETLHQQIRKQRVLANRSLITIYLNTEQHPSDIAGYPLSLDDKDLKADWAETVEWLQEHSREEPPHVFGTIVEIG